MFVRFVVVFIPSFFLFFFNDTATTEIYTLSLHDALPISPADAIAFHCGLNIKPVVAPERSEEHTSELQSRRDLVCRLLLEKKNRRRRRRGDHARGRLSCGLRSRAGSPWRAGRRRRLLRRRRRQPRQPDGPVSLRRTRNPNPDHAPPAALTPSP